MTTEEELKQCKFSLDDLSSHKASYRTTEADLAGFMSDADFAREVYFVITKSTTNSCTEITLTTVQNSEN